MTTRDWLVRAHGALESLLPRGAAGPTLLTDDLTDSGGRPVDVFGHFGLDGSALHTLVGNCSGLMETVQGRGGGYAIETPAPAWPGFEDVWIPIRDGLQLSARLGLAEKDGRIAQADCIIVMPGLSGDHSVKRTRDIVLALRSFGYHALALELRGHGQTEARYPDVFYCFGAQEIRDLFAVSAWLKRRPEVRRTGLIGYCWGANLALLAAWESDTGDDHPGVPARLRPLLPPKPSGRHFRAGVLAFSPVLRFEELFERTRTPWAFIDHPPYSELQDSIRDRMIRKGHPAPSGDLLDLIQWEFSHTRLDYAGAVDDALDYIRILPFHGKPAHDKLERVRMPVLIVHAANDPFAPAQELADYMATLENPSVAGMILPGGGHVGFAPYARDHFFSLLLNFFDPQNGAAATCSARGGREPTAARETAGR
ncbi:MAG: alpha/beta fold hydrolase [Planctomycetes bacterium]|nr:alpha/beta fold hydrolase [Planctomycetota bacterium]